MVYQILSGRRLDGMETLEWPVGQVVKTEASHAFNIGSNPVRVTKVLTRHEPVDIIQVVFGATR